MRGPTRRQMHHISPGLVIREPLTQRDFMWVLQLIFQRTPPQKTVRQDKLGAND